MYCEDPTGGSVRGCEPATGERALVGAAWLIALAGVLAFVRHVVAVWDFTVDDAYIVFRYAQNLVRGIGPTFNATGPPVEGVTQMLWLGVMAVPHILSLDPVPFAKLLGVLSSIAMWGLVLDLALVAGRSAGLSKGQAWLAGGVGVAAIAALPFAALHAVSGLGTAFFACLLLAFVRACVAFTVRPTGRRAAIVGAMGLLLGLARPEGNAFAVIAYVVMVVASRGRERAVLVKFAALFHVLPGAAYFAGRWAYYGLPMPLPFYVKMQSTGSFGAAGDSGIDLAVGMWTYLGPVWLPLVLVGVTCVRRPLAAGFLAALGFLAVQTIPSQIMGYGWRYFFPALPVLAVVAGLGAARIVQRCGGRTRVRGVAAALAAVLGGAVVVAGARGADTQLSPWVTYARGLGRAHVALGNRLAEARHELGEPRLSISDAGAVPYLSGWHTIDTFGLNDPGIAFRGEHRAGLVVSSRPDVIVLISGRDDEFVPWLPWESAIHAAALDAGYEVVEVLEFSASYFLWILCPVGSPIGGELWAWHPEGEVPDPFGTSWSGPGAPGIDRGSIVDLDRDFGVLRVVDGFVRANYVAIRVRVERPVEQRLRVFVHVVDPSDSSGMTLHAHDFDPIPPLVDLAVGELRAYRWRLSPAAPQGTAIRIGFFDPSAPPYPRLRDREGRDHVELRPR